MKKSVSRKVSAANRRSLEPVVRFRWKPEWRWADYDPMANPAQRLQVYDSRADQRGNRPDLKPFRVAIVPVEDSDMLFEIARGGYLDGAKAFEGGIRGALRALGLIRGK